MEPTKELIDDIFRQKVLRARQLTPDERFRAGPELFAMACEWAKWGIRDQHPDADEAEVFGDLEPTPRVADTSGVDTSSMPRGSTFGSNRSS